MSHATTRQLQRRLDSEYYRRTAGYARALSRLKRIASDSGPTAPLAAACTAADIFARFARMAEVLELQQLTLVRHSDITEGDAIAHLVNRGEYRIAAAVSLGLIKSIDSARAPERAIFLCKLGKSFDGRDAEFRQVTRTEFLDG